MKRFLGAAPKLNGDPTGTNYPVSVALGKTFTISLSSITDESPSTVTVTVTIGTTPHVTKLSANSY